MSDLTLDELDEALGITGDDEAEAGLTARQERIIAGFEDIQKFVDTHKRRPQNIEGNDIFERLYAVRLDQLRAQDDCVALLLPLDRQGLLAGTFTETTSDEYEMSADDLAAALGIDDEDEGSLTHLRHVKPRGEVNLPDEIASRTPCADFDRFKPLFLTVQNELETGIRHTRPFELKAEIMPGRFFIVGGQKAYVAEMDEVFTNAQGRRDARLRVIFDNGTESNMLMASLQRALHKDEAGRRITEPDAGPLFAGTAATGDMESGTIYVLRSRSDLPLIAAQRDLIHKIGVTGSSVESRITNAKLDATYLMSDVDVVATYTLFNVNRAKLENLLHKFLAPARLEIQIQDRFGNPVIPREWYLVPLPIVDEIVEKLKDGTIGNYVYNAQVAQLVAA